MPRILDDDVHQWCSIVVFHSMKSLTHDAHYLTVGNILHFSVKCHFSGHCNRMGSGTYITSDAFYL